MKKTTKVPIVFQAISWHSEDANVEDDDVDTRYFIKIFGRTLDGQSVSVTVGGVTPTFYIKLDDAWTRSKVREFEETFAFYLKSANVTERHDFWGFSNHEKFRFLKLDFWTQKAMRSLAYKLRSDTKTKYNIYESNIDPILRFMHDRKIDPNGWIRIEKYSSDDIVLSSNCTLDVQATHTDICRYESDHVSPFKIACFDIECDSSHGDFPVPNKDYKRLAIQLIEVYATLADTMPYSNKISVMTDCILTAFRIPTNINYSSKIDVVYPKRAVQADVIRTSCVFLDDVINKRFDSMPTEDKATVLNMHLSNLKRFPELYGDQVIQIGTTLHKFGERQCYKRHIVTLGSCDPIPGVTVESYDTELEMLLAWKAFIVQEDPDIISGYNILGFDMEYLHKRAEDLMRGSKSFTKPFHRLGRLKDRNCEYKELKLSSSALGDNLLKYIDMHGRVIIDLMKVVQRDHKLDSYKLDHVAQHFTGDKKDDISPKDIFRLQKGSSTDRAVIAKYCVQDCELCNKLIMQLDIVSNNMGMSNVCTVPLSYIFMRGQGIKIFSLVAKEAKENGFIIPTIRANMDEFADDGYEGAIVLEPKEGIYIDDPVSVLDYASLYPSSMISENLSHDCIVMDKKYDNLPGVEYLDVVYDEYEGLGDEKKKSGTRVCRYAQLPNGQKGLIPNILQKLLKARKTTRKKIELVNVTCDQGVVRGWFNEKNSELVAEDGTKTNLTGIQNVDSVYSDFQKAVFDGMQIAYKVTANSLYGQCGARTSPIYLKDIAACTTATGRKMIITLKTFLEDSYQANIIYGDSVTGYTPCVLKVNGQVVIEKIENIAAKYGGNNWISCQDPGREEKEGCELNDVMSWTSEGWTPLRRIIRHTLAPHKKILRVLTHTGVVDVTDEHSLIDAHKQKISAKSVKVGDILLHNDLPSVVNTGIVTITSVDEARTMGMFMGDGSCGKNDCDVKSSWAVNMMYDGKDKIVPVCILGASKEVREAFWQGLYDAGGNKDAMGYVQIDQDSQISASTIYMLATSIGYKVSINTRYDKPTVYRLTMTNGPQRKNPDAIKKITEIPYQGFVYDLTTRNHEFSSGVGRMVVHNTDSIFAVFPNKVKNADGTETHLKGHAAIMASIKTAMAASKEFKQFIKPPHDAEYEKTFWPFALFKRKKYVGNMYELDDVKFKQKSMGIVLKRRDNAPIVKHVYGGVLDIILNKQDIALSIEFMKECLDQLIKGGFPLKDLIVTKSLKSDYKDPTRIAHKVLAERMGQRDPGNKPQINDRIPYVYIRQDVKSKKEKVLQGDKIEHPDFIASHKLTPDYEFYITNQIMKPLLQLYSVVVTQIPGHKREDSTYVGMYEQLIRDGKPCDTAKEKVLSVKEEDVKQLLFDPFLVKLHNQKNKLSDITKWFSML